MPAREERAKKLKIGDLRLHEKDLIKKLNPLWNVQDKARGLVG